MAEGVIVTEGESARERLRREHLETLEAKRNEPLISGFTLKCLLFGAFLFMSHRLGATGNELELLSLGGFIGAMLASATEGDGTN